MMSYGTVFRRFIKKVLAFSFKCKRIDKGYTSIAPKTLFFSDRPILQKVPLHYNKINLLNLLYTKVLHFLYIYTIISVIIDTTKNNEEEEYV